MFYLNQKRSIIGVLRLHSLPLHTVTHTSVFYSSALRTHLLTVQKGKQRAAHCGRPGFCPLPWRLQQKLQAAQASCASAMSCREGDTRVNWGERWAAALFNQFRGFRKHISKEYFLSLFFKTGEKKLITVGTCSNILVYLWIQLRLSATSLDTFWRGEQTMVCRNTKYKILHLGEILRFYILKWIINLYVFLKS